MAKRKVRRKTDGNHILYHYLQKELLTSDVCLAVSDACGEAGDRPRYMDPSGYLFSNGS